MIFAHHLFVLDEIENFVISHKVKYIRIDGNTLHSNRHELINTFQNDNNCSVAILGITACAHGLTLTAASTVVFAEMYYTPAIMIQAEDRVHRIGQENHVNVHYLYGDNTVDNIILPMLFSKFNIVTSTLDQKVFVLIQ